MLLSAKGRPSQRRGRRCWACAPSIGSAGRVVFPTLASYFVLGAQHAVRHADGLTKPVVGGHAKARRLLAQGIEGRGLGKRIAWCHGVKFRAVMVTLINHHRNKRATWQRESLAMRGGSCSPDGNECISCDTTETRWEAVPGPRLTRPMYSVLRTRARQPTKFDDQDVFCDEMSINPCSLPAGFCWRSMERYQCQHKACLPATAEGFADILFSCKGRIPVYQFGPTEHSQLCVGKDVRGTVWIAAKPTSSGSTRSSLAGLGKAALPTLALLRPRGRFVRFL